MEIVPNTLVLRKQKITQTLVGKTYAFEESGQPVKTLCEMLLNVLKTASNL